MAEVVTNSAEAILKGLYSRNPAVAEAARHLAERLSADEFLRLLHLYETESARIQLGTLGRFCCGCLFCLFMLLGYMAWNDPQNKIMTLYILPGLLLALMGVFGRYSSHTNEDTQRVESSLRGVFKTTQSSALAESAAVLLYGLQKRQQANFRDPDTSAFTPMVRTALLRILPTLQTAEGWKPEDRQALFELMQDDTYEHKLVTHILDAAARWHDVDALPQVITLTKREDRPLPLRRHANEVMTLLLAERQKRQAGDGLLRASEAPQGKSRQELLRPAAGHSETPPEELLRPQA